MHCGRSAPLFCSSNGFPSSSCDERMVTMLADVQNHYKSAFSLFRVFVEGDVRLDHRQKAEQLHLTNVRQLPRCISNCCAAVPGHSCGPFWSATRLSHLLTASRRPVGSRGAHVCGLVLVWWCRAGNGVQGCHGARAATDDGVRKRSAMAFDYC